MRTGQVPVKAAPGNLGVILSPEAVGTLFLRRLGWRLVSGPMLSLLCLSPMQRLTPERKMEVEELIPLARCQFSVTPSTGAVEEDDGFVDILEKDLKVNSLALSGPLPLPS